MTVKGLLICFTGIDGAGKTTLSKELIKSLEKQDIDCKYVYARLNPFISRPIMSIGRLLFLSDREIASKNYVKYYIMKMAAIKRYSALSSIYVKILLIDFLLQMLFKVKIPLKLGKNIVCDRYIYDTIITDLSVHMNYSVEKMVNLINNLLQFIPKPNITFLLDVPEEVAYQRKTDISSVEYLKEKRWIYLDVGKRCEMIIMDGCKPLEELKILIQNKVLEYLRSMVK
jgi:thymidylate kinase